jgi:hypothetical protein
LTLRQGAQAAQQPWRSRTLSQWRASKSYKGATKTLDKHWTKTLKDAQGATNSERRPKRSFGYQEPMLEVTRRGLEPLI